MGGGGEEDPQKLKRIVAAAYDYENDTRWADYWSNVLLPPHMSSRSDVVDHFKRKFYQRYFVFGCRHQVLICRKNRIEDPDLLVGPMTTRTAPAKSSAPLPQSTPSAYAWN